MQIDHSQVPRSGRFEYALVEVVMTARTTAKKLLSEIVCRFGVPEVILRDQGPALTTTLTKEIWAALGVQLALHIPYHPQSSGKVERMNGTLKKQMAQETNMSWPDS